MRKLGIAVSAGSVRNILDRGGLPPAPRRDAQSWRSFVQVYLLAFIAIRSRRIEYFAITSRPRTWSAGSAPSAANASTVS